MKAGDTLRLQGVADRHTWVIISDPEIDNQHVLLVSFTGYYPGMDPSCIVEVEEYSILDKRSCIYYADIKEASVGGPRSTPSRGENPAADACFPGVAGKDPRRGLPEPRDRG
jgi:hypothetical protein